MDPDHLDEVAARQAGIVTWPQLMACGWSETAVVRGLDRGSLLVVVPGVYRVRGAPWTRQSAFHAALAIGGSGAAIARSSAAEIHGLADSASGPVELVMPHARRVPRRSAEFVTATRSRTLAPSECTEVQGLTVTNAARTLLDLAATQDNGALTELTAAALRRQLCTIAELVALLAAHPRARGRRRLHVVIDLLGEDGQRSRTDVEVAALHALVSAGLPRPVVAYRVLGPDGRFIAEVDLAYPSLRIAIEIDGFAWHSSPGRKRADEYRQNRLILAGWTVLRFSASDVRRRPQHVIRMVRRALEAAEAH